MKHFFSAGKLPYVKPATNVYVLELESHILTPSGSTSLPGDHTGENLFGAPSKGCTNETWGDGEADD